MNSGPIDSVCLVAVVHGEEYERYAERLFESARDWFRPTSRVELLVLPARPGWPDATLYRHHVLLEHRDLLRHDFVYLADADMRFESTVGPEILAPLVATRHPGYVTCPRRDLPYERRPESAAFIPSDGGSIYCAGAFVGGLRDAFLDLSSRIAAGVDRDDTNGVVARWHDESHLNRCLVDTPAFRYLSPAYCYPDDDREYRRLWPEPYPRCLVTLDKVRTVGG